MSDQPVIKLPPGVLEEGTLRMDWSGFSTVLACDRAGWHELAWRRKLPGVDPALRFGDAIHRALDVRQRAGTQTDMETEIDRAYEQDLQCPECRGSSWDKDDTDCGRCGGHGTIKVPVELADDEHRTPGRAKEVAGLYLAEYARDSESFDVMASELAGEKELGWVHWRETYPDTFELHTTRVLWQFKIDGKWRDRAESDCLPCGGSGLCAERGEGMFCLACAGTGKTHKLYIKDTKTMKECGSWDHVHARYHMSPQLKLYCWSQGLNDAVVDSIVVRPGAKRPSANAKPRTEFNRLVLHWSDAEIEECRRDTLFKLGQWLTACARHGQPPPMTGAPESCVRFGRRCPYYDVCQQRTEGQRMSWLLSGAYEMNTWNPLAEKTETI